MEWPRGETTEPGSPWFGSRFRQFEENEERNEENAEEEKRRRKEMKRRRIE